MSSSIDLVPSAHIVNVEFFSPKQNRLAGKVREFSRREHDIATLETRIRHSIGEHGRLQPGIYAIVTKHDVRYYYQIGKTKVHQGSLLKKIK